MAIMTPDEIAAAIHEARRDGCVEFFDGSFHDGTPRTEATDIADTLALHPRLLDTLRSAVLQLEAVPEDVPGWMQRTHLCRRARELATEAGETWAMGNGETPDSGGEGWCGDCLCLECVNGGGQGCPRCDTCLRERLFTLSENGVRILGEWFDLSGADWEQQLDMHPEAKVAACRGYKPLDVTQ